MSAATPVEYAPPQWALDSLRRAIESGRELEFEKQRFVRRAMRAPIERGYRLEELSLLEIRRDPIASALLNSWLVIVTPGCERSEWTLRGRRVFRDVVLEYRIPDDVGWRF